MTTATFRHAEIKRGIDTSKYAGWSTDELMDEHRLRGIARRMGDNWIHLAERLATDDMGCE